MARAKAPDAIQRVWFPEWRASSTYDGDDVTLVMAELLARHPAEVTIKEIIEDYPDDAERIGNAVFELTRAAFNIGRAVPGIVEDLGQPGPEDGYETYLRELAKRAGVETVPGRIESDGMFHMAEKAGTAA